MLASSNKAGSEAATVAEFLPIFDTLYQLNVQYAEDEFGQQYNALLSSLKQAMMDLGVVDYEVAVGDPIDPLRMTVVESQTNDQQPAQTVLQLVRLGMELEGNVVRPAQVIASLGSEQEAAEAAADEEEATGEEEEEEDAAAASGEPDMAAGEI